MPDPTRRTSPRIAIFGAGSVGCHLGGQLAPYADVTLIGRPAAMAALDGGLTLTATGRPPIVVPRDLLTLATTPDAVADADYVLVTVKSAATADVGREMAAHLRADAVVVSFQNGLRNPGTLRVALPAHAVSAGMVPYNILQTAPNTFHRGSAGTLMLDEGPHTARLSAALTEAGLPVEPRRDMREVQAAKLLLNLNNAINALSGLPLRDQLGHRPYRSCVALCQAEALAVYRAAGIRPARLGPLPARMNPHLLRLPDALFRRVASSTLRIDAQARSSTWEDLQRGRPTEIDSLQGEIVALAARHHLGAPANAHLITLVRRAEATPATWTGPALLAELTAAVAASG